MNWILILVIASGVSGGLGAPISMATATFATQLSCSAAGEAARESVIRIRGHARQFEFACVPSGGRP